MAQTVKNPPEIQETWDPSLDWEDPLEEDILAWRILMDRGAWQAIVQGVTKSWTLMFSAPSSLLSIKADAA